MQRIMMAALASFALAPAAFAQTEATEMPTAEATFVDPDGNENGTATLTGTPSGVLIELEVSGLPEESWVAFHVHETGECDPETDHDSAGGHFNPHGADHGFEVETGAHAGDMPNQYVGSDGVLRAEVLNTFVSLDTAPTEIRGRALMVHAEADDHVSQPTGDAGDRLACAVIE